MKHIIKSLLIGFLLFSCLGIQAQETNIETNTAEEVIIVFKNGGQIKGELVNWDFGKSITVMFNENEIKIPNSQIKYVVQDGLEFDSKKLKTPYNFKEAGLYGHLRLNLIGGNGGSRSEGTPGIGGSISGGKRFSRLVAVGGGLSFDNYIIGSSESILAPFVEFTGFVQPENLSLMYNLSAGYGFAFKDEESGLEEAKGGWMIYPSIGFRAGKSAMKWTFDAGYKFQKANMVYRFWGDTSDQRLIYKRLTFRIGLLF